MHSAGQRLAPSCPNSFSVVEDAGYSDLKAKSGHASRNWNDYVAGDNFTQPDGIASLTTNT